ncbi:PorP/SprF family type IX secretion system membrane protein [Pedobacter sandarakinus]|uniref:PorP/SprF family type IX secretion system membrane protein n=1 Tax=Pedobacter sandarakinus TaxID=353156 RepID=UPI002248313C|nr:type IX secretion system membrane protein PorP/SprF [Pedobacter sandarakinus]MCX2576148.1 type IX secretion system membrane protein PorP/SprF [Pedobacter sandarakinus]
MKKALILFTLLLVTCAVKAQQDAQYSQYMFNGIYINPAYAGYKEELNLHSFYRNQWVGIKGSPKNMSLAIDATANDGNVGLAFQVSSDKLGAQSSLAAYANYAYRIRVGNDESTRLAFGLGIGIIQNGLNGSLLDPIDFGDVKIPVGMQNNLLPDARVGAFYSTSRWYAGISVDNLMAQYTVRNNNDVIYFPTPKAHYYITAGLLLPINEAVQIKPSFLLKDDRGGPTSLDINAFVLLGERIWLGGTYRTAVSLYNKAYLQKDLDKKNAIVAMTEIFASPKLRIGYAFDYTISSLLGYNGGSHEISVGFYLKPKNVRMLTPRYF